MKDAGVTGNAAQFSLSGIFLVGVVSRGQLCTLLQPFKPEELNGCNGRPADIGTPRTLVKSAIVSAMRIVETEPLVREVRLFFPPLIVGQGRVAWLVRSTHSAGEHSCLLARHSCRQHIEARHPWWIRNQVWKNAPGSHSSVRASFRILSTAMFRCPRSTPPR